jgi:hypothetical protein
MSTHARNIKEGIQRLAGTFGKDYLSTVDCVVLDVNEQSRTCNVKPVTTTAVTEFADVFLSANPNDGFICYPEIGSTIRVAVNNKGDKYVLQFSDLQKLRITTGETEIIVQDGEILLGDGSFNGLVKVDDLITKLNNLENDLNTLKTAFSTWVVVPADGGAALKAITATWSAQTITPTQSADIENTLIKHGQ